MHVDEFLKKLNISEDDIDVNVNLLFLIYQYNQKKRHALLRGGTRSGKTYNTLLFVIYYCLRNTNKRITITSRDYQMLRRNIYVDFLDILDKYKIAYDLNKTYMTFKINNNLVSLSSYDDEKKARGEQRDLLILDEANTIKEEIYFQLKIRTSEMIIFTYNPSSYFYIHEEFDDDYIHKNELITTYKHNKNLSEHQIKEIESIKDEKLRDIYVNAEFSDKQYKIFNYKLINKEQFEALQTDYCIAGIDFAEGASYHAFTIVKKNKNSRDVYAYNALYINSDIDTFSELVKKYVLEYKVSVIFADYAQSEYIQYMRSKKINVMNCKKYNLAFSYNMLNMYNFYIVENTKIIREIKTFETDDNFNIKSADHAIDSLRYAMHFFY